MNIYLVGGAVRDSLLGIPVKERDYVVVGATEADMLQKGFTRVGKDFPVFLHPETREEYALARTERKRGHGYKGFECHASPDVTLEDDLLRRDLTINAMAQDPQGHIIDPYNGQLDLQHRVFRHVSDAFQEDPLRIFRVARFFARYKHLGFSIATETMTLMQTMGVEEEITALAAERVWQETARAIEENNPFDYFHTLSQANVMQFWSPNCRYSINSNVLKESEAITERLADTALSHAARCALVVCYLVKWHKQQRKTPLHESTLCEMLGHLKVPKQIASSIIHVFEERAYWLASTSNADDLLSSFNRLDIWRQPNRIDLLKECFAVIEPSNQEHLDLIVKAAVAARAVDAQRLIQQGITGSAIKPELAKLRKAAIQAELDHRNSDR